MALLMDDDEDEQHKHFNYNKIVEQQNLSKKKKKKLLKSNTPLEEDNFQVRVHHLSPHPMPSVSGPSLELCE